MINEPALMLVLPVYVFKPLSVKDPAPDLVSVTPVPLIAPEILAEPTEELKSEDVFKGAPVTSIVAELVKFKLPVKLAFLVDKLIWFAAMLPVILMLDKKLDPLLMLRFFDVPASVTDPLI